MFHLAQPFRRMRDMIGSSVMAIGFDRYSRNPIPLFDARELSLQEGWAWQPS
jgi:hypothetical protein